MFLFTGICPDGDECPCLHRTAGDTERRYHLRYYKTAPCVHETDSRGFCVKNGVHCAFAHGNADLRNPVYDIRDLRVSYFNLFFGKTIFLYVNYLNLKKNNLTGLMSCVYYRLRRIQMEICLAPMLWTRSAIC